MAYIQVEGLKEFQRAVRAAKDRELDKRLGQASKKVGQLVIDRLSPAPDPLAVGSGRGAHVRPSASKREVLLRVGGGHRAANGATPEQTRMQPWGARRALRVGKPAPARPDIQGTVERHFDEIGETWMDAVIDAFAPAFAEAQR